MTAKFEHYVPRFYLKNFSVGNAGKFLFCFDKSNSHIFGISIKKAACEKYFYDVEKDGQTMERELSKVETISSSTIRKLIEVEDLGKLKWLERVSLANFLVIQEFRTKEMRLTFIDMCKKLRDTLSKHKLSPEMKKEIEEMNTEEFYDRFHIDMLKKSSKVFVDLILGMKWILIENDTKTKLLTSDHPVNRYNPIDMYPLGNLGYLSEGIQIFLPLTPTLSICIYDLALYFKYPDKMRATRDNIVFQNSLQVQWATRFLYSDNNDFSLVNTVLTDHPELRNEKKKRIA